MALRTRNIVSIMAASLAFVVSAAPRAEAQDLRAHIPFEFRVDVTTLPAGFYDITQLTGTPAVQLRSPQGGVMVLMDRSTPPRNQETPQLTFTKYGDRYFLRDIRISGERELHIKQSVAEREMERASKDGKGPAATLVAVAVSK
jgi:hypothetical protein